MKILVIGSGGREHALVWKLSQSKLATKIFCAPGNGGIAQSAECIDIKADDVKGLLNFVKTEKIDLTVVGPEVPLSLGIVDEFIKNGLKIFGPNSRAAKLEASKIFSKQIMQNAGVPTAFCEIFTDYERAKDYAKSKGAPLVIKADGLAQGKGVVVAITLDEALKAIDEMMRDGIFGEAGKRIIIEECLVGEEASILVLCDGKNFIPLASAQDHKRAFDGDSGANTGGMGAYSPALIVSDGLLKETLERVIAPVIEELTKEGIEYKGVLYAGIMLTKDGPKVLEFNVRFGDPETQAILPRLKSDLLEVMLAVCEGKLDEVLKSGGLVWDKHACVCVVCASAGYPGNYEKGKEISGLDKAAKMKDVIVFHSGTQSLVTSHQSPVKYITNGGRVLGVTGLGNTIKEAIDTAYKAVKKINFEGMHYRKDIGKKAMGGPHA